MLHLTDQAADVIAGLIDESGLPPGAGLRIDKRPDHAALAMSLAASPGPDDSIIREHAVAVFLGPVARTRLNNQTLDARCGKTGSAFFLAP